MLFSTDTISLVLKKAKQSRIPTQVETNVQHVGYTWCVDWFVDVTSTLVRSVVELGTLMFAETWSSIRTGVHVTDAISLAFAETVTTAMRRPASITTAINIMTNKKAMLLCRLYLIPDEPVIILCKTAHRMLNSSIQHSTGVINQNNILVSVTA